jgi:hypothetical protein
MHNKQVSVFSSSVHISSRGYKHHVNLQVIYCEETAEGVSQPDREVGREDETLKMSAT